MDDRQNELREILRSETLRLRESFPHEEVIFPIIEIVRALDYHTSSLKSGNNSDAQIRAVLFEKYHFGWALAFKEFYRNLKMINDVPVFTYSKEQRDCVDQTIQHAGSLQIAAQLLDCCKADLMTVSKKENAFLFEYLTESSELEYYERLSTDYYFELIEGILEQKKKGYIDKLPQIRSKLKDIVNVVHDKFITYKATDEFDLFYKRLGYLYLMTTQIVDDFDETDTFGGIPYKKYMDQVEYVSRAALMHRDCCVALFHKTSHKINMRDTLTYGFSLKTFSDGLADYLDEKPELIREAVSCLSINKDNYEHHLSYPGVSPPPYFQIGNGTLIRSIHGCLDKPVQFLNRELKRKHPTDYFNAVNNRENRFRRELYDMFPYEWVKKVHGNVLIKTTKGDTDIDAVLFDEKTGTIGLFQLKWQDSFSTSMKERFSRISNLIPKSVEWIEKVTDWVHKSSQDEVIRALRIGEVQGKLGDVILFVIARHHVHFTEQKLDHRATWASWFQVLEASAKVKNPRNQNPIAELAAKLSFFSPNARQKREQVPPRPGLEIKFADYQLILRGRQRT